MAGKAVVSFKIGYSVTHVAEVDFEAKNPRVYHAFTIETPDGVLDDEGVNVTEEFVEKIKRGMIEAGIHNNRVVFTISSGRVANRDVTIPLVKEAKIRPLLIANSKEYFPVDMSKYQLVYRVIEQDKSKKEMKLSVFAVPNTLLDSYQTLANALGLQVVAMDYYGNGIYQAMMHSMPKELAATICIEDNSSLITIIQDGKTVLQRNIGYGIDDAVQAMMQSSLVASGTTYLQALEKMQMNLCFNEQLKPQLVTGNEDGAASMSAKESITRSLTMLIGNISRVLDYYTSRNSEAELDSIALVGLGADCQGLDRLLTNELGITVSTMRSFGNTDITRGLSAQRFHLCEFFACIGSVIKPLNFVLASEVKETEKQQSLTGGIVLCALCAATALVLVLSGYIGNLFISRDNEGLRSEIASKQDVIERYNDYIREKVVYDGVVVMDSMTEEANSAFLEFLAQMEEKMPNDLLISSMTANSDGITMSVTTSKKESAAEAIMQLRTFTGVGYIQCSGVTEELDDNNVPTEYFDISVSYLPSDSLETAEGSETEIPTDDSQTDENDSVEE